MSESESDDAYTPTDLIRDAEELEHVIRCTDAVGTYADFTPVPEVLPGMWVRMDSYTMEGHVVEVATVRNAIKLCSPDVKLLAFEKSLFEVDE